MARYLKMTRHLNITRLLILNMNLKKDVRIIRSRVSMAGDTNDTRKKVIRRTLIPMTLIAMIRTMSLMEQTPEAFTRLLNLSKRSFFPFIIWQCRLLNYQYTNSGYSKKTCPTQIPSSKSIYNCENIMKKIFSYS